MAPEKKLNTNICIRCLPEDHNSPLAEQAYTGAAMAERVHAALLGQASDMENFTEEKIYVWPVCGGPKQQYEVFAAD